MFFNFCSALIIARCCAVVASSDIFTQNTSAMPRTTDITSVILVCLFLGAANAAVAKCDVFFVSVEFRLMNVQMYGRCCCCCGHNQLHASYKQNETKKKLIRITRERQLRASEWFNAERMRDHIVEYDFLLLFVWLISKPFISYDRLSGPTPNNIDLIGPGENIWLPALDGFLYWNWITNQQNNTITRIRSETKHKTTHGITSIACKHTSDCTNCDRWAHGCFLPGILSRSWLLALIRYDDHCRWLLPRPSISLRLFMFTLICLCFDHDTSSRMADDCNTLLRIVWNWHVL